MGVYRKHSPFEFQEGRGVQMTRAKQVDFGVPHGVEIVEVDGGKSRRAVFKVESPFDPGEFILIEALPEETTKDGVDPYDVGIPAEDEGE